VLIRCGRRVHTARWWGQRCRTEIGWPATVQAASVSGSVIMYVHVMQASDCPAPPPGALTHPDFEVR
jgi:hypothetical protein